MMEIWTERAVSPLFSGAGRAAKRAVLFSRKIDIYNVCVSRGAGLHGDKKKKWMNEKWR